MSSITCDIARVTDIQNSNFLRVSELLMLSLSVLAIPTCIWALYKCLRTKLFHINIRVIAACCCLSLLCHSVGRAIQHSSSLLLWTSNLPMCEKVHNLNTCVFAHFLYNFGMYSPSFTTVLMVIERTVATRFFTKYETNKCYLGIFLVSIQVFLSLLIAFVFAMNSDYGERPVHCFSDNQLGWALSCKFVMIVLNVLALFQCYRLKAINKNLRITPECTDLSHKFQVEENRVLVDVIYKFTKLDFFFMVAFFLFGIVIQVFSKSIMEPNFLAYFELIHCVPLYSIVVLSRMTLEMRNVKRSKTSNIFNHIKIENEEYFRQFKKQWD